MNNKEKIYKLHVRGSMFVHVRIIGRNKIPGDGEFVLIVPVAGEGSAWVNMAELKEVER